MRNKWEKVKAKVKLVLMVDDDDDQAPSEQDIEDALKILVSRKPELLEDSEGYNRTFRELRNELVPKIDEGITLTDQNSAWKPWLSDMQSSDTWETPRSDSYYQYLVMDKNSSYSTLDYTANEIVKLLADPRRDQPAVSRKGLILGDVQSGKTRTYIALMNKAADCGYRLIIVLTSDNENLRQQTQERIDTDFIGWQDGIRVGIGKYQQNIAHPSQLTNENDFVAAYDKAFHSFPRPTWNSAAPCVAVIKKEERAKEQLGVVLDSSYFIEYMTVDAVERTSSPMYPLWDHNLFDAYLRRFGLGRNKKIKDLSRGMQMKLMLAVALSHDAKLLILDEPTSGLDVLSRDELMDILSDYVADGEHSVIFSTHITADLERCADFLTYITHGMLYYSGPKDEFEDAFRLVKGGPDELTDGLQRAMVGIRTYATGFDALVRTQDIPHIGGTDGLLTQHASIEDVIRLTNTAEHTAIGNTNKGDVR